MQFAKAQLRLLAANFWIDHEAHRAEFQKKIKLNLSDVSHGVMGLIDFKAVNKI